MNVEKTLKSRTHDMNTFTCEQCGENVVGKKTLKNHMRKHNTAVEKLKKKVALDLNIYSHRKHLKSIS